MKPSGLAQVASSKTLVEALALRAEYQPRRCAIRFLDDGERESGSLTYAELDRRARAVAAKLQERCQPGDRAVLIVERSMDFVTAFFGCLYAKVIAVPAYPPRKGRTLGRIQAVLGDAGARLLIAGGSTIADFPAEGFEWFDIDQVPESAARDYKPAAVSGSDVAFLQYTSGSTGSPKGVVLTHANLVANVSAIRDQFRYDPASVMVSWLPLFHDMGLIGNLLTPLFAGCLTIIMPPAAFLERPLRWLEAITRYRGTLAGAPNFAYELCAKRAAPEDVRRLDLSALDVIYSGAEPVRPQTIRKFLSVFEPAGLSPAAVFPCYGLAEATLLVSGGPFGALPATTGFEEEGLELGAARPDPRGRELVASGRVIPGHVVRIVQPESLEQLPDGRIGEIWLSGPSVAQGYWKKPEQTEATFGARIRGDASGSRYLRTGDLGFFHGGLLVIAGREKDVIIVGGRNYYPQDIELTVESADPAIRPGCCAVVSWDAGQTEQLGIVAEVAQAKLGEDLSAVCDRVIAAVAREHELAVARVLLIRPGSIPKTSSGKLQRQLARKGLMDDRFEAVHSFSSRSFSAVRPTEAAPAASQAQPSRPALAAPGSVAAPAPAASASPAGAAKTDAKEITLARLVGWFASAAELAPKDIDPRRPLAAYGIDSVIAVELATRIQETWGIKVPQNLAWEFPTLEALAGYIDGAVSKPEAQPALR